VAEFLTTKGTSNQLEQIIMNAQKELVLVSPFLSISKYLLDRLQGADRRGVEVILIYGKVKDKPEEMQKLRDLQRLSVYYHEELHAKCFYNENDLIITSMNLHQFSEKANREMGVLVKRGEDNNIYNEAIKEVRSILESPSTERIRLKWPSAVGKASEPIRLKPPGGLAAVGKAFMGAVNAVVNDGAGTPNEGFCIRCGKAIPYDPARPLCLDDFVKWNEWKDPDYAENWCHRCRKRRKVSMGKPLCRACWRVDND